MSDDRRIAARKSTEAIKVNDLTSITDYSVIAKTGQIVDASTSGFLMAIHRADLVPSELRENLNLNSTLGQQVVLYLPQMNLDLDGTISRATHTGKGNYLLAIEFSADVPEYWRACLIDLLPQPGEIAMDSED